MKEKNVVTFTPIPKLGPTKEMTFAIKVKVAGAKLQLGTCAAAVTHDGLTEPIEDNAAVKVSTRQPGEAAEPR